MECHWNQGQRCKRGYLPYAWCTVSSVGGFDQLVSFCPIRQLPSWNGSPVFCKMLKQVRNPYFDGSPSDVKIVPHIKPCEPAGWCQAESTGTDLRLPLCVFWLSVELHGASRSWYCHRSSGNHNRSCDTAELSNLSEMRIVVRVRAGTWQAV